MAYLSHFSLAKAARMCYYNYMDSLNFNLDLRTENIALEAENVALKAEIIGLKTENAGLKTQTVDLKTEIAALHRQFQLLIEQIKLSRKQKFGASSEKSEYDFAQLSIFNEAELFVDEKTPEPELTVVKEHYRRTRLTTDKLPPDLPVEVVEHDLSEDEFVCPECGDQLHHIGQETIREELKIIPAKVVIVRHIRHTYGCRRCETEAEPATIVKAPVPEPVIKGSFASPEAVAHIMVQKFVMGVPVYRQESQFKREGILLSRQTMCNWLMKCSEDWLMPIYNALYKLLLTLSVLHADETTLQVLREAGRAPQTKSYLWVYRTSGYTDHPIVLSDYQPGRGSEYPKAFLAGFKGFLHTDGWEAYRKLPDVTIVGCWQHARSMYDDALKVLKPHEREGTNALRGKRYCDRLFDIERDLVGLTPNERYLRRLELAKPVLDEYHAWLMSINNLGKSLFCKAVNYSLNQWPYLQNYLLDGRLEISNNRTERTVKMFVIDRKNFLFAAAPRGAKASAVMFSIIQTAIENNLNPINYLVYIFRNAPNLKIGENPEMVERLLPWNVPESVRARG